MHESSLMKGLMSQILAAAESHQARNVISIHVVLGALSNITPAHFGEHFVQAAHGTPAEGARLDITCATDLTDPHAQEILIKGIEVAQ